MPITPTTTRILGSSIALDSAVARNLDTNGDGNVDPAELVAASKRDLTVLRAEVAAEVNDADALAEQTKGRGGFVSVATTAFVLIGGSVLLSPLVGIPLGLVAATSDVFGSWANGTAKDAARAGRRAMSLIDVQIAQKT